MNSKPKYSVRLEKTMASAVLKKQWSTPTILKLGIQVTSGGGGGKWESHPHHGPS